LEEVCLPTCRFIDRYLRPLKVFGGRYPVSNIVQRVPEAPRKAESNQKGNQPVEREDMKNTIRWAQVHNGFER
jgi:hypothetical protein